MVLGLIMTCSAIYNLNYIEFYSSNSCPEISKIKFVCPETDQVQFLKGECMPKKQWYKKALFMCRSQLESQNHQSQSHNLISRPFVENSSTRNINQNHTHQHSHTGHTQDQIQNAIQEPQSLTNKDNFHMHADHKNIKQTFLKGPFAENEHVHENQSQFNCSSQDALGINQNNLITTLQNNTFECLSYLFYYNQDLEDLFTQNHLNLVLTHLDGLDLNNLDTRQLPGLLRFVRTSFYNEFFYNLNFSEQSKDQAHNIYLNILNQIPLNTIDPNLNLIINEITAGTLKSHSYLFVDKYSEILNNFNQNPNQWNIYERGLAVYSILYTLDLSLGIYDSLDRQYYQDQNFINAINLELIQSLESIASNQQMAQGPQSYIVENAIWILGHMVVFSEIPEREQILQFLTNLITQYPRLSNIFLRLVITFDHYNNCQTSNVEERYCIADFTQEVESTFLPNEYSFDDGSLEIQTSLELEETEGLYQAANEVQNQFNRITQTLMPLRNDSNSTLKVVIYGSRSDYENYHNFLTNLPTNNGGMYIEPDGTFYTYQRTPQESIYTLEELFRHEYAHFLVGRFLIEGLWGQEPIYANDQVTWFDEGFAEFLTGSTQTSVNVRQTLISRIREDGSGRLTLQEIFNSNYGTFKFYRYAAIFFNYLYENDISKLRNILELVKNSNVEEYNNYINQLANDIELENSYQNYINQKIQDLQQLSNPRSLFIDYNFLDTNNIQFIQSNFNQTRLGYRGNCSISSFEILSRFSCKGVLTGTRRQNQDFSQAWREFNDDLNEIIAESQRLSINNFNSILCRVSSIYFIDLQNGFYYPSADYNCTGPLGMNPYQQINPLQKINQDFQSTRISHLARCHENDQEEDQILCNLHLSSQVFPNSHDNLDLENQIQSLLNTSSNQVYASNPNFYADFQCDLDQSSQSIINYGSNRKYMVQGATCYLNY